jgi:hypothetical protein
VQEDAGAEGVGQEISEKDAKAAVIGRDQPGPPASSSLLLSIIVIKVCKVFLRCRPSVDDPYMFVCERVPLTGPKQDSTNREPRFVFVTDAKHHLKKIDRTIYLAIAIPGTTRATPCKQGNTQPVVIFEVPIKQEDACSCKVNPSSNNCMTTNRCNCVRNCVQNMGYNSSPFPSFIQQPP